MEPTKILLAGESWVSISTHIEGWDFFNSAVYEEGHKYLYSALSGTGFDFTHITGHRVATDFPLTLEELRSFDVVILSDIGANTLLLHPDVWLHGKTVPNRLKLIAEWVRAGGALVMCGGYLSFAGIYGSARYHNTPVEEVLPVVISSGDDRRELPEGGMVRVVNATHPIMSGISGEWPVILGLNELTARPEADIIAEVNGLPFIAVREVDRGRSIVWTSDIGPHWCPTRFTEWAGYRTIWQQSVRWLGRH
jgi:uncharacterized membrane protein